MNVKATVLSVLYGVSFLLILIGIGIHMTGPIITPWVGDGMAVDGVQLITIGVIIFVIEICFNYFSQNG